MCNIFYPTLQGQNVEIQITFVLYEKMESKNALVWILNTNSNASTTIWLSEQMWSQDNVQLRLKRGAEVHPAWSHVTRVGGNCVLLQRVYSVLRNYCSISVVVRIAIGPLGFLLQCIDQGKHGSNRNWFKLCKIIPLISWYALWLGTWPAWLLNSAAKFPIHLGLCLDWWPRCRI